jgi:hypothetical protein
LPSTESDWPVSPMRARTRSRLTRDVIAADPCRARVGPQQRGQDTDHGGLARAVRPEQRGHRPGAGPEDVLTSATIWP